MRHDSIETPTPRPGRPRSPEAHAAILDAAIALVREVGYDAASMDGIAARAGVGKATVYRRWSGKETLVAEAIGGIVRAIPVPDTGQVAGDVLALLRATVRMYQDPATAMLLSGLVAAMARSEAVADAVRTGFVARWREAMRAVLVRGVARGELRADTDPALVIDLCAGPLFHRYLMLGERIDDRLARDVVAVVLRGLAPEGGRGARRGRGAPPSRRPGRTPRPGARE